MADTATISLDAVQAKVAAILDEHDAARNVLTQKILELDEQVTKAITEAVARTTGPKANCIYEAVLCVALPISSLVDMVLEYVDVDQLAVANAEALKQHASDPESWIKVETSNCVFDPFKCIFGTCCGNRPWYLIKNSTGKIVHVCRYHWSQEDSDFVARKIIDKMLSLESTKYNAKLGDYDGEFAMEVARRIVEDSKPPVCYASHIRGTLVNAPYNATYEFASSVLGATLEHGILRAFNTTGAGVLYTLAKRPCKRPRSEDEDGEDATGLVEELD
jgi:hypothetical protein